jgi:hypothetical protein
METDPLSENRIMLTPVEQSESSVMHSASSAADTIAGKNQSAVASSDEGDICDRHCCGRRLISNWLRYSWYKVLKGFASCILSIALYTVDVVSDLNLAFDLLQKRSLVVLQPHSYICYDSSIRHDSVES